MPTTEAEAAFELGIKFGALFHQFIGTPVSPGSAASLTTAIEESIENQPGTEAVSVAIDEEALSADLGPHGYTGLRGRHLVVEIELLHEGRRARGSMAYVDGYPLMTLDELE
ncbi:MAG: dihydroneopterin aldolase family protein [Halodesulfurarchaeum sp.]